MTSAAELARAVQQEARSLLQTVAMKPGAGAEATDAVPRPRPLFSRAQVNAMLRIEASRDAFWKLEETDGRTGYFDCPFDHHNGLAPRKFIGVTIYPVDYDLPAPGWRVINPMRAK